MDSTYTPPPADLIRRSRKTLAQALREAYVNGEVLTHKFILPIAGNPQFATLTLWFNKQDEHIHVKLEAETPAYNQEIHDLAPLIADGISEITTVNARKFDSWYIVTT